MGLRVGWLELDGGAVGRDRLVQSALLCQRIAQVGMGLRVGGSELDGGAVGRDRLVKLALLCQRIAQVGMGLRVGGSELDGGAVGRDRLVKLALLCQRIAQVGIKVRRFFNVDCILNQSYCAEIIFTLSINDPKKIQDVTVTRLLPKYGTTNSF